MMPNGPVACGDLRAATLCCQDGELTMSSESVLTQFERLNIWKQGEQLSPHKPLLVLYALGRWQQGNAEVTFKEAEPELTALLREFGPSRKSDHPEQPFLRLQNDGVWTVTAPPNMPMKAGDFTKERRKLLTAKIASGECDGIIVTHSSFERMGMSRQYQEQFLREQIAEYEQLLHDGAKGNARAHRNIIKTLEKQKAQREAKLKDLLAEGKKDDGLHFDELGHRHHHFGVVHPRPGAAGVRERHFPPLVRELRGEPGVGHAHRRSSPKNRGR